MITLQQQYIAQWHDSFVAYTSNLLGVIAVLVCRADASDDDKRCLEVIKGLLTGRDATDVEQDLAAGVVRRSTLDKIEKINKEIADVCLAHIQMDSLVREFWKHLSYLQIEQDKRAEVFRLSTLRIPVAE